MLTSQDLPDQQKGTLPRTIRVALVGNPNTGKTTLFNALTGLKQKVANYPGVTVERKSGIFSFEGLQIEVIDLPGAYSLRPTNDVERITRDVLLGMMGSEQPVDVVVVRLDAGNLERNLYFATQVLDLGLPGVVALTMNDEAASMGQPVDPVVLEQHLGRPVVETVAPTYKGITELKKVILQAVGREGEDLLEHWREGPACDRAPGSGDRQAQADGAPDPAPGLSGTAAGQAWDQQDDRLARYPRASSASYVPSWNGLV